MGEITVSNKTWKKIRKGAKKKKKFSDGRIAGYFNEERQKCPIRMDFDHDSKEEIARKWEEIKKWNAAHPEANPWREWENEEKRIQRYLPSKFYRSNTKNEKKEERKVNELDKLEEILKEKNIPYNRVDETEFRYCYKEGITDIGHHRIDVFNDDGDKIWDAICQHNSYGYDDGLLEVRGEPVVELWGGNSVCGYLTAEDVMSRYEKYRNGEFEEPKYCLEIETIDDYECYDDKTIDEVAAIVEKRNEKFILIPMVLDRRSLRIRFKAYERKKKEE